VRRVRKCIFVVRLRVRVRVGVGMGGRFMRKISGCIV
jgi:hypothetical protein